MKFFKIFVIVGLITFISISIYIYKVEENKKIEHEKYLAKVAEEKRIEAINIKRKEKLGKAKDLFKCYYYDEAIETLNDESILNDEVTSLITSYTNQKNTLVKYEGNVEHIFFHSLILYPEYLFPNLKIVTGGYNAGFSFRSEIKRLLPLLLDRGYVLYNINDVFKKDENGIMKKQDIYLPEGKKPLILSIDDPTYHYGIGFGNRLIIDESGNLAGEEITPQKEKLVTYDTDVELVVDSFVKENPEFSYKGAKGIIAATGYMGIFGYDLKTKESLEQAKAVCDKLKENGWLFASHSYTHNRKGFFGENSKASNIEYDTREWKKAMEPVIGTTNIFIAPFGYTLSGQALQVILNNGFDIYCNVNLKAKSEIHNNYALMSRVEIGGYSFVHYKNELNKRFFEVDKVIDSHRPPIGNEGY